MNNIDKDRFLKEITSLHYRHELSKEVTDDYYEPGMMEYLSESDGYYDETEGSFTIMFEVKGTRYEGRTEMIESVSVGDIIKIVRESENIYNHNNFTILTDDNKNVGNVPAELCNAMAPLYDKNRLEIKNAEVTYVEPISKRSRYAKQAVLFIKAVGILLTE